MIKLRLSDDLVLPLDAVTQVIGFLGRRGSGKTYAATKLAEQMLEARAQIVAVDPVGVWHGLRLGAGYDIPVLGGLHNDIPLEPSGGALVAELIVERGISAVLDVSQMISSEQARFAYDFADRFFQLKKASPSAVHLFLEECQEMVPENPQRGGMEPKMLHAFQRIVKLGRNFGVGVSLISQRPQEVSKKVLNQTELLLAFQTSGPQERKAIKGWIADKDIKEDIDALLPKLEVGSARAWSPQWLKISKTITIAKKRSLDASSTPRVGARAEVAKALTPIDLEELRGAMAATIKSAQQNDPKFLQKHIAELEAAARHQPGPVTHVVRVEIPVLTKEHHDAIVKLSEACFAVADLAGWKGPLNEIRDRIAKLSSGHFESKTPQNGRAAGLLAPSVQPTAQSPSRIRQRSAALKDMNGDSELGRCERAILTVLVQRPHSTVTQVSILSGYSHTSSGFTGAVAKLRSAGFIEGTGKDMWASGAGRAALGEVESLPTGKALLEYWCGKLGKCESKMLRMLYTTPHRGVDKHQLGEMTGYSVTSSGFTGALAKLRTLELVSRGEQILIADTFN